jgi:hypothetical protein
MTDQEIEKWERDKYERELEAASRLLQKALPIGQVKAIGLLEVAAGCKELIDELNELRTIIYNLPHKEDIELAIRANSMGGLEWKPEMCRCDPDVGCSPCPYCAIDSLLRRILKICKAAEAAKENKG